jgi:hypothetical protein
VAIDVLTPASRTPRLRRPPVGAGCAATSSAEAAKQFGQADLQDVRDLPRCVDGDVDSAAFEQTHVRPMEFARFGEAFL